MLRSQTLAVIGLLVAAVVAVAQPVARDTVVELRSGDKVVVRADGTMVHYDARGEPIPMEEGVVMIGKDGARLVMKRQSLWREALETAGRTYAKATAEPDFAQPKDRTIELADGGRVTVDRDGAMAHFDRAGKRIPMADGEVMVAKGGSRILMDNGTMWREAVRGGP